MEGFKNKRIKQILKKIYFKKILFIWGEGGIVGEAEGQADSLMSKEMPGGLVPGPRDQDLR